MIAYGTGKAGQWAKGEAERRFDRMLWWMIVVAAAGSPAVRCRDRGQPAARGLPLPAGRAAGASRSVLGDRRGPTRRRCRRRPAAHSSHGGPVDRLARERIRHLHGGQAEALVAFHLRQLDDGWHLFNNVRVGGAEDVDHVLVGPAGLFCVSTKSHRGLYAWDAAARTATLNGRPTDHVRGAQAMAMQLRHWMQARLRPEHGVGAVPFVNPVLCVPLARWSCRPA